MKKYFLISFFMLVVGLFCLEQLHAQLPMTGAGKGAPVFSGPTPIILVDQNDITTANWPVTNPGDMRKNSSEPDPFGGNTATSTEITTGANFLSVGQTGCAGFTGGVSYSLKFSTRTITATPWILFLFWDGSANGVQAWVNPSTGSTGTTGAFGDGVFGSVSGVASTNSYFTFTLVGSFASSHASCAAVFETDDADNTRSSTTGQQIAYWGMGVP